mgnify:CR=1 FL=1
MHSISFFFRCITKIGFLKISRKGRKFNSKPHPYGLSIIWLEEMSFYSFQENMTGSAKCQSDLRECSLHTLHSLPSSDRAQHGSLLIVVKFTKMKFLHAHFRIYPVRFWLNTFVTHISCVVTYTFSAVVETVGCCLSTPILTAYIISP